jgi:hypothetical protein
MQIVYVVTFDAQVQQVFATQDDAETYIENAASDEKSEDRYVVQPFQVATLNNNGGVIPAAVSADMP